MKERVETVLAEVFTQHSDRRTDLFKVEVESADEKEMKLKGRVLSAESLEAARKGIEGLGVNVDVSGVKVLRAKKGTWWTVGTNLTDLHVEPSFLSEMLLQVMGGVGLEALEESADGKWVFVRQVDGYLGWAYKGYLREGKPAGGETHVVVGNVAQLCKEPGAWPVGRVMCGTFVKAGGEKDGWVKVEGGWVPGMSLRPVERFPLSQEEARMQIVHDARTMVGVYYLWGGGSPFGIDCSGLAQLCHRLSGYTLPRDADMQFRAGKLVEGEPREGDLVFFHSDASKEKITHVGISTGGWGIIHSSRSKNGVYEEDVRENPDLSKKVAGVRTFLG